MAEEEESFENLDASSTADCQGYACHSSANHLGRTVR